MTKITQFFSINSVQYGPDPKFMKQFTAAIQTKSNKICHSPVPVQSNTHLCTPDRDHLCWAPPGISCSVFGCFSFSIDCC